ncbi:MAG: hypothetical protein R3C45_09125 [Phycisphaerales bacterium]
MYALITPAVFISIMFAIATYSVVKSRGGNPVGWALGALVAWPVLVPIAAARYRTKSMLIAVAIVDVVLVAGLVVVLLSTHTAKMERHSVTNLHELSQALFEYSDQHDGMLPAKIDDLIPHLRKTPNGKGLPPALVSPFSSEANLVGYQLYTSNDAIRNSDTPKVRIKDLPADTLVIKDLYAPPEMRIGVYADGSVRSY